MSVSLCRVCGSKDVQDLYETPLSTSLTSISTVVSQKTVVQYCKTCCHLQSNELEDISKYYRDAYNILINSDEEDQLYSAENGVNTYRAEHQARTFLKKVPLAESAKVLDYGAGKGATIRKVASICPSLNMHFFDVSPAYKPFWLQSVPEANTALFEVPENWAGRFDVVTSFFALEHVADPCKELRQVRELLKPGGLLYFLVPNTFANRADFIVADHINHFSPPSLTALLLSNGYTDVAIDAKAHQSAYVVTAAKQTHTKIESPSLLTAQARDETLKAALELAYYWNNFASRIDSIVRKIGRAPFAIYGAGFYGSVIKTMLPEGYAPQCFLDQNPFLQGTSLMTLQVISPDELPPEVRHVVVGLNPDIAREAISRSSIGSMPDIAFHFI